MRRKLVLLTRRFTQIAQKVFLQSNRKKKMVKVLVAVHLHVFTQRFTDSFLKD